MIPAPLWLQQRCSGLSCSRDVSCIPCAEHPPRHRDTVQPKVLVPRRAQLRGWVLPLPLSPQTRISCKDVPAETLYDVLHDTHYRKKWDSNMIETYDIGRLTVNADVGYYSCEQPLRPPCPPPHAPLSVCGAMGAGGNGICPQGSARAP